MKAVVSGAVGLFIVGLLSSRVTAQPMAKPQSFVHGNRYVVFTPPIGWPRALSKGEIDGDPNVLRISAPDGRMFIEVYPAWGADDPGAYMEDFLRPYWDDLRRRGRDPRMKELEIRNPPFDSSAVVVLLFAPKRRGTLVVDRFKAFECYGFMRAGFVQPFCTFAVDEQTLSEKSGNGLARYEFLKSMRPNDDGKAVEWSPTTDKEVQ